MQVIIAILHKPWCEMTETFVNVNVWYIIRISLLQNPFNESYLNCLSVVHFFLQAMAKWCFFISFFIRFYKSPAASIYPKYVSIVVAVFYKFSHKNSCVILNILDFNRRIYDDKTLLAIGNFS